MRLWPKRLRVCTIRRDPDRKCIMLDLRRDGDVYEWYITDTDEPTGTQGRTIDEACIAACIAWDNQTWALRARWAHGLLR